MDRGTSSRGRWPSSLNMTAHYRSSSKSRQAAGRFASAWRIIKLAEWRDFEVLIRLPGMRDVLILFVHLIVTVVRLAGPGGLRSVVAESALVRHQLLILNRGRKRAPNLRPADRIIAGLCTLFLRRARTLRSAIVLNVSTLLHLHAVLCKLNYVMLISHQR